MKLFAAVPAALAVAAAALTLGAPSSAHAQDSMKKPMEMTSPATGKPVVMVPMMAKEGDMWKVMWASRYLDDREVRRFRAQGFSDATIRGCGNLAMRTGIDIEYFLRQVRESGMPLAALAHKYGLSTDAVNAEIPGYGLEYVSVMAPMSMSSMSGGSMMHR